MAPYNTIQITDGFSWVFSDQTPASEQGQHALYNTTGKVREIGQTWNISYADGTGAAGIVYADQVVVGQATVTSQAVEAATSASSSFVSGVRDGLLGLAMSSLNTGMECSNLHECRS